MDLSASRRAAMPAGTEGILDARSLAEDHAVLAALLRAGMTVLDVGCGTGAITRGIAQAVFRAGRLRCWITITPGRSHIRRWIAESSPAQSLFLRSVTGSKPGQP